MTLLRGPILELLEGIDDGTAVNLGTMERIRVADAAAMIFAAWAWKCRSNSCRICPRVLTTGSRPIAWPKSSLLGTPEIPFREGIVKTIDWYVNNRNSDEVRSQLQSMLTEC